jgi:hypothetical protein
MDKIGITVLFKFFGVKKINELVVTSNKLTYFVAIVTSGGLDVASGPSV